MLTKLTSNCFVGFSTLLGIIDYNFLSLRTNLPIECSVIKEFPHTMRSSYSLNTYFSCLQPSLLSGISRHHMGIQRCKNANTKAWLHSLSACSAKSPLITAVVISRGLLDPLVFLIPKGKCHLRCSLQIHPQMFSWEHMLSERASSSGLLQQRLILDTMWQKYKQRKKEKHLLLEHFNYNHIYL